jgi:hypothetical protein
MQGVFASRLEDAPFDTSALPFPMMLHMVRFYDGGIHRMGPIIKTSQTPALSEGSSFEGHEAPHCRLLLPASIATP